MERTPQETFQRHVAALTAGDMEALVADYAEDALVLTLTGEYRGRSAIRELFEGLGKALPNLAIEADAAVFAGDVLLLRWRADSSLNVVEDAVDTFVFHDGLIQIHTISATLKPKS